LSSLSVFFRQFDELFAMNDLKIFTGRANVGLSKRICDYLGIAQGQLSVGNFPVGETQ